MHTTIPQVDIRYTTKRGASVCERLHTNMALEARLKQLARRGQPAKVYETNGDDSIGGVWKMDRRWYWSYDQTILAPTIIVDHV